MSLNLTIDASTFWGPFPELTPAVVDVIEEALDRVARELRELILEEWPRDTRVSVLAWEAYAEGTVLVLVNPVDYAEFVRRSGEPIGASGERVKEHRDRLMAAEGPAVRAALGPAAIEGSIPPASAPPVFRAFAALRAAFQRVGGAERVARFRLGGRFGQ